MILCDIGNSYLHFFHEGRIWREESKNITKKDNSLVIYYISVNQKSEKKLLQSHKYCINIANLIKLDTIYQGLGIDRKVACLSIDNGIIVDCGSAITIDIMQNKIHLGGYILPGLSSYLKLFANINALRVNFNLDVSFESLPQNTKDALSCGCIKSIVLTIQDIAKDNYIYFTGGDGKYLSKFFPRSIYDNTLIFKGMMEVLRKNNIIKADK